jgi:acetate kinase
MKILVLNGGSSTLKATLREVDRGPLPDDPPPPLWEALADWGRRPGTALLRVRAGETACESEIPLENAARVLHPVLETLWSGRTAVVGGPGDIDAVGHRVVHGGHAFRETTRIDARVREEIARYCDFAPEHNRLELEAIEAAEKVFGPEVPEVAVFDTAFHATMPPEAAVYPVPYRWYLEENIRRYGFHGISHQYASRRASRVLGAAAARRMVTCHLGNGASLAAVLAGVSVDTSMGFTPLEGLMMGTRSGSIDPGILIYLVRYRGYGADELDRVLNKESGLKGVSGISGDMREILAAIGRGDARARLAFDIYTRRLCREVSAMAASLGGLDALVFTGGVGENSKPLRARACERLAFLGVALDAAKNESGAVDTDLAAANSRVRVVVVRADEDWAIARECQRLLTN